MSFLPILATKYCSKCKLVKDLSEFYKNKSSKDGHDNWCSKCKKAFVLSDPEARKVYRRNYNKTLHGKSIYLFNGAKTRAKERGISFSITKEDVLELLKMFSNCPICLIEFRSGEGTTYPLPCSPSLDCIISKLGYVQKNVALICFRCNTIKSNASASEIYRVWKWLREKESSFYIHAPEQGFLIRKT